MATVAERQLDKLVGYMVQLVDSRPELLNGAVKEATPEDYHNEDVLVVEDEGQARLCVLLAEALMLMSQEVHPPSDRAVRVAPPFDVENVKVLKKVFGGLEKAAKATGVARTTLWRAVREATA